VVRLIIHNTHIPLLRAGTFGALGWELRRSGRLKKLVPVAVVGLLLIGLFLSAVPVAAEGSEKGTFPDRDFYITRSPPGGPRTDAYTADVIPTRSGDWWVSLEEMNSSAIIVQVYSVDAGVLTLESSSKVRYVGDQSTHTPMLKGFPYKVTFTPYGKGGTSRLREHFTPPSPPDAKFVFYPSTPTTGEIVTFDASNSTDKDDDIVSYAWDFGDGGTATGVLATHSFAAEGKYTVTLRVTDSTGLVGTNSTAVSVGGNKAPVALFQVQRDLMVVAVDASASYDPEGAIADYHWVWGDGSSESTGITPTATHTYATPGKYTILLHVRDAAGAVSEASREVSVNTWTVDWSYYDFFNVPFGEWWDMRTFFVGDRPIAAECFSEEGIANEWCMPMDPSIPDVPTYPYTYWAPSPTGDASIYAPYRFDAVVTNAPVYTIDDPVLLPSCADLQAALAGLGITIACPSPAPLGGSVAIEETFQYLTTSRAIALRDRGCPDLVFGNDGFITDVKLTLTMDGAAAARLFGVTSGDQWTPGTAPESLIRPGCGSGQPGDSKSGLLEQGIKAWLEAQGNGPYNVYNAFGNKFQVFAIDAAGSYDATSGKHTLNVEVVTWGFEVLTARWFYWGSTPYVDGVMAGAEPAGWWGMEAPWFEDFRLSGTIGTSFTGTVSGVAQYHFRHLADPGANGLFDRTDDVPKWVWAPILADRLYGSTFAPVSELDAYTGYAYTHTTPGSSLYGKAFTYDYVPALWPLRVGETETFAFPTGTVVVYDPDWSPPLDDPLRLGALFTPIILAYSVPATGVGTYDASTGVLSVVGPTMVGTPPTTSGGKPLESRPSYHLLGA